MASVRNMLGVKRFFDREIRNTLDYAYRLTYNRTPVRTGAGRASLRYDRQFRGIQTDNNFTIDVRGRRERKLTFKTHLFYGIHYVKYAHAKRGYYMKDITQRVKNRINNTQVQHELIINLYGKTIRYKKTFLLKNAIKVKYVYPYKDSPSIQFTIAHFYRPAITPIDMVKIIALIKRK